MNEGTNEFAKYKEFVTNRLKGLEETFSSVAIGDFSKDVSLCEIEDEFTETYAGVQIMLDVIRTHFAEMNKLNDELTLHISQLKKENTIKNEFLATIAHELRNPLSPVLSSLELIERQGYEGKHLPPLVQNIHKHVLTIAKLLDDILDLNRISRRRLRLQKEGLEFQGVLENVMASVQLFFKDKNHTLVYSFPAEKIYLNADSLRIEQIFRNILFNAGKYTPPGGNISVTVRREGNQAVTSVKDSGIGIKQEELKRIFEPYTQGDYRTTQSTPGTGLGIGLAIARKLVRMHGGTIEAMSDGPGHGSEFLVRFPTVAAVQLPMNVKNMTRPPAKRKPSIFIVDDNEPAANGLSQLLSLSGYRVVGTAFGWREALEGLSKDSAEVVLMDIGLPEIDGYELAGRVRAEINPVPKLIALTGYGQDQDKLSAVNAGFSKHLTKPVGLKELEEAISEVMDNSGTEAEEV